MKFLLRDARLAFPSIWKPSAPAGGGDEAFGAAFIIAKNHPQVTELKRAMQSLAKEKWGAAKFEAIYRAMEAGDKLCLHNGDTKADYDGYAGALFINSRARVRPSVFDGQRNELVEADGKPYAGCYVNASLELWAQDNQFGKRINAQLRGVQFLRDGDAFGAGAAAASADEFDEIGVADGAEDDSLLI
jgi:hypothetical protein